MGIYISLLVLGLLLILATRANPALERVSGVIYTVVLAFIGMFRYDVGQDYFSYESIYDKIAMRWDYGETIEIGFRTVCKLCSELDGTAQLMFAVMSAATLILTYQGLKYFSKDISLSLFVFMGIGQLYLNTFNAVRQALAIALFIFAMRYVAQRKLLKYLLMMALATTFHASAIILVPLYWILRRRWSKISVIIAGAVLALSGRVIINMILNSSYSVYLMQQQFTTEMSSANVMYFAMSVIIFICSDSLMKGYRYRDIFSNLNILAMFCFMLYYVFSNTPVMMVVTRISYYFMIAYPVILAMTVRYIDDKLIKSALTFGIVAMISFMFYRSSIINGDAYNLLPYTFNFNLFT